MKNHLTKSVIFLGLTLFVSCGATTGVGSTRTNTDATVKTNVFNQMDGDYPTGSWTNTTYSTTGAVTMNLDSTDMNTDFSGTVVGTVNPSAETHTLSDITVTVVDDDTITVSGTSSLFGAVSMNVNDDGTIASGSAPNVPGSAVDSLSFTGTKSGNMITLTVTVNETGGATSNATVTIQ